LIDGDIDATGAITLNANSHLNGQARCVGVLTIGLGATVGASSPTAMIVASLSTGKPLDSVFAGTLTPGSYSCESAAANNLPVQLDCQSNNLAVFKFVIGGALSFNANVQMINGNCKAQWSVDGAASLAAGVSVDSNIEATGAINLGADAHLTGCARAGGALNLGAGATVGCAAMFSASNTASLKNAVSLSYVKFNENNGVETDKKTSYIVGFVSLFLVIVLAAFIVVMIVKTRQAKKAAPVPIATAPATGEAHSVQFHVEN